MARLIDADDLIERIEDVLSRREHRQAEVPSWLQKIIDELPTAYNVDKVVEEMESLRIDKSNYFGVLNVVAEKYDRANEMLNDAIDIVRKGGVE